VRYPKISVVISTYDRPHMLKEALGSVVEQTYLDFEVVVVDDGSNTALEVCKEIEPRFQERHVPLRCIGLAENSGYQAVPKNVGIYHADGSYIAYLDDDNLWDPHHLQTLIEAMEKEPGRHDIVYSRWRYEGLGPGQGEFPYSPPTPAALQGLQSSPSLNFIDTSAILHSKARLIQAFGFSVWNEEMRRFGDWELVARCAQAGLKFTAVDAVTFTYRWHDSNLQLTRPPELTASTVEPGTKTAAWNGEASYV
jgi:glycosyltransferase involved in cell wall biosynthesis